ncbi:MAG: UDP-4-amino-4,6-dideoxy-N-acetyl-beta-L-altrosamine N-acetyltransferase [Lachnospiraceae bacterium]|nr:UDP-4-amino-4,6-dideoxy-N-acetyl-beta-L-altrosamine N-acetyltransferase [Lachnospiraceae bacterium]
MDKEINAICRQIKEEDLEMIMNWRMMPEITRYMNSDPVLTLEGQKKWFKKIRESERDLYWMLEVDGVPSGVVSLVEFDGHKVHTGVYIAAKEKRSLKLTMYLQWNLYRYSFEILKANKVCEEVFEANKGVNRILDMCGSKREGVLRNHVYKNGEYYNVIVRGILKEEWTEIEKKHIFDIIRFESKDGSICY